MDQINKSDFENMISRIINTRVFWNTCYYSRCMKKLPHGGIVGLYNPNIFFWHYPIQTFFYFCQVSEIPYFFNELIDCAIEEYSKLSIEVDDILDFCFKNEDPSWFYISLRVLQPKLQYAMDNIPESILWDAIDNKRQLSACFEFEIKTLLYAFICRLIETKSPKIHDLEDLCNHELLIDRHNKYGLSEITGADFKRQGFVYDKVYYLYSIFLDTSIGDEISQMPLTALLIKNMGENCRVYMRCDNNLAIPSEHIFSTATWDMQKYRGINLSFANIVALIKSKEIVVHFNPKTYNKVLLTVKKDCDDLGCFFHIVVEELWNPSFIRDQIVITNLIHAKYYPELENFRHIDFEVIQYQTAVFIEKFNDAVATTSVPIDKYGDLKYKIWCIEGDSITIEDWSHLVCATLDEPFRNTFFEMFS